MPKAKKDAKKATFYLSNEIIKKLERHCKKTGLSKTVAVERLISKYITEDDDTKEEIRSV